MRSMASFLIAKTYSYIQVSCLRVQNSNSRTSLADLSLSFFLSFSVVPFRKRCSKSKPNSSTPSTSFDTLVPLPLRARRSLIDPLPSSPSSSLKHFDPSETPRRSSTRRPVDSSFRDPRSTLETFLFSTECSTRATMDGSRRGLGSSSSFAMECDRLRFVSFPSFSCFLRTPRSLTDSCASFAYTCRTGEFSNDDTPSLSLPPSSNPLPISPSDASSSRSSST